MSTTVRTGAGDPEQVARRIAGLAAEGSLLIIALDHDGTLSPIAPRPEEAVLAVGAPEAIAALCDRAQVVILSGRGLEDLAVRFADLPVTLVAEHGLRRLDPGGTVELLTDELEPTTLAQLRDALQMLLRDVEHRDAWIVEDKGVSIAVHHRLVPDHALEPTLGAVHDLLAAAAALPPGGHVQTGKAVLELRPAGADKGSALRALAIERPGSVVVMVGDDTTDEPALAAAEASGGVGVLVADEERPSAASERLTDPTSVVRMLDALVVLLADQHEADQH